jgi:hypothetical protein
MVAARSFSNTDPGESKHCTHYARVSDLYTVRRNKAWRPIVAGAGHRYKDAKVLARYLRGAVGQERDFADVCSRSAALKLSMNAFCFGLPELDEVQLHATLATTAEHRFARHLGTIVEHQRFR